MLALKGGPLGGSRGSVALLSDALERHREPRDRRVPPSSRSGCREFRPMRNQPVRASQGRVLQRGARVGVMIILAAVFIAREAYLGFPEPEGPEPPPSRASPSTRPRAAAQRRLAFVLLREVARREVAGPPPSPTARHLWTDVFTSAGVDEVRTLLSARDGVVGARPADGERLVAVNILWSGSAAASRTIA